MTGRVAGVLIILALITLGAWRIHADGYQRGQADAQLEFDKKERRMLEEHADELAKARDKERTLQDNIDQIQQEKAREVARLSANVDHLYSQLRKRPERTSNPSGVPEGASPGAGCTGQGLARPDAEFLAGYAADAARLQLALNQCEAAYQSVRQTLNQ